MKSFICYVFLLCFISLVFSQSISITVDKDEVGLGQSVKVFINYESPDNIDNITLWPFVNGLQWGSNPMTNASGQATITLPFPNVGKAQVVVSTISGSTPPFTVGNPVSSFNVSLSSNPVTIVINNREIVGPNPNRGYYMPMEWEPWFTPTNDAWVITEAIPILGRYNSYNIDVIKQHSIWMTEAGVDSLMVDWTNNLWGKQHWADRNEDIQELCNATTIMLETYSSLSLSIPVPKVILLLGLDNGVLASTSAVVEELDFIYEAYVTNTSISKDLWVIYEGKPLIVILDSGNQHTNLSFPTNDTRFTIRWMSTQLQVNRFDKLGFWSWMDGSLNPVPTFYNGSVEALTVTPAFFDPSGWLDPQSYPRRGGTTFVEQFKEAYMYPPKFLIINQWNEFAGQANGQGSGPNKDIFMDTYSLTLSDDIEPTDMTICAYPRPNQKCGGWGFFYLNLLRALGKMHEIGPNFTFTILTIGSPEPGDIVSSSSLDVTWNTIGLAAKSILLSIGDKNFTYDINTTSATIDLTGLPNGVTSLTVSAIGAQTPYSLSYDEVDVALDPMITPSITVAFMLSIN